MQDPSVYVRSNVNELISTVVRVNCVIVSAREDRHLNVMAFSFFDSG